MMERIGSEGQFDGCWDCIGEGKARQLTQRVQESGTFLFDVRHMINPLLLWLF
jgi:hypothetical protein